MHRGILNSPARRLAAAIGAMAVGAAGLMIGGAGVGHAEPGGIACQLAGTATFSPNGPGNLGTFGYTLSAALSECQTSREGAPAGGAIGVGQTITESVPITLADGTVVTGTASYQAPAATGSGTLPVNSCVGGSTAGTGIVAWPDGSNSVIDYTTQSLAAGVGLQGTVVDSVALALVPGSAQPAGTAPGSVTVTSNNAVFPVGEGAQGLLEFSSDDPTACTTDAGLATADIQGLVGVGSTS